MLGRVSHNTRCSVMDSIDVQVVNSISTLTVTNVDETLQKFPVFMEWVERKGIGAKCGVFKVRLGDNCTRSTPLVDLLGRLKPAIADVTLHKQLFISSSSRDNAFGVKNQPCTDEEKAIFIRRLNRYAFSEQTCCTKVLDGEGVEQALLKHYFSVNNSCAMKQCSSKDTYTDDDLQMLINDGKEARLSYEKLLNHPLNRANEFFDDEDYTSSSDGSDNCNEPWSCERVGERKNHVKMKTEFSIVDCAGIMLNNYHVKITPNFSLSKLNTILDLLPAKYDCLKKPFFYIGTEHSTSACHIKDAGLWSIYYLHYGAPKVWIVVHPRFCGLLDYYLCNTDISLEHFSCRNLLGHKFVFFNQDFLVCHGIPHSVLVQHPGEFVVLSPFAAHVGFSTGTNLSEAANFATVSWIPLGLTSLNGKEQIHLDMTPLVAAFRPDLLKTYINGNYIVGPLQHPMYIEVPTQTNVLSEKNSAVLQGMVAEDTNDYKEEEKEEEDKLESNEYKPAGRYILQCPCCPKTYRGGVGRLQRLILHIKRLHADSADSLVVSVENKYSRKASVQPKKQICSVCGKALAGSSTHLQRHIERFHNI